LPIVIGQSAHQLEMKVIHHARAIGKKSSPERLPRCVDSLLERAVQFAPRSARLHRIGLKQADLGHLDAGEALCP
jgi:hypothetical protein